MAHAISTLGGGGKVAQPQQLPVTVQQQQIQPQQQQGLRGGVPPTGLIGSEQALRGGLAGGLSGLQQGINRGSAPLQQFFGPGAQAQQRQGALSGAFGQAAQQQAFDQFLASPEQAFLRERGDLAVTRNAAALGGLGGGRVQQELQRQGIGLAAQDFQNQFDRLGVLSGQGLQAAGALGNIGLQGGLSAADLFRGTGRDLAAGRFGAGRDIAAAVGGTASALSNLINQQGQGVADLLGQQGGNIADRLQNAGGAQQQGQDALGQQLANVQLQQARIAAGLPGVPGIQETQGIIGNVGNAAAGVGSLLAASDRRLKTNIQKIGETAGGTNIYSWDWNATGMKLAQNDPTIGVIAQEVPEASTVGPDGYLMVDYRRIS